MEGGTGQRLQGRRELYDEAVREFGVALDRVAAGYEADHDRRRDLRQEIHLQLWRSLELFDGRCSLKTWVFRVAHNTAVTYVNRERRSRAGLVTLDEMVEASPDGNPAQAIDERRAVERLSRLIYGLKPGDRQIMLAYLEGMDAASIAEVTGLSRANVSMKVHRIKQVLARNFFEEGQHA